MVFYMSLLNRKQGFDKHIGAETVLGEALALLFQGSCVMSRLGRRVSPWGAGVSV